MGDTFEKVEDRVLGRIDTPRDFVTFKLGSALKMENTVLGMLGTLEQDARSDQLKQQVRLHAEETRGQIHNIEKAFSQLGEQADEKPSPTTQALDVESKALVKIAGDGLVDEVILAGAADTEHHEIAVYEALIAQAEALGEQRVSALLRENLEQEQHMLGNVSQALQATARQVAHQTA
jgi:ferritin-like metal-binding protein YciE